MNKENLKHLLTELKEIVSGLESEIHSDNSTLDVPYEEVLKYYETNTTGGGF